MKIMTTNTTLEQEVKAIEVDVSVVSEDDFPIVAIVKKWESRIFETEVVTWNYKSLFPTTLRFYNGKLWREVRKVYLNGAASLNALTPEDFGEYLSELKDPHTSVKEYVKQLSENYLICKGVVWEEEIYEPIYLVESDYHNKTCYVSVGFRTEYDFPINGFSAVQKEQAKEYAERKAKADELTLVDEQEEIDVIMPSAFENGKFFY